MRRIMEIGVKEYSKK